MNKIKYEHELKRRTQDVSRLVSEIEMRQGRLEEVQVMKKNLIMEGYNE